VAVPRGSPAMLPMRNFSSTTHPSYTSGCESASNARHIREFSSSAHCTHRLQETWCLRMHEIELRSVVDELGQRKLKVQEAGGQLLFEGLMVDRHYASAAPASVRDILLRVRSYRGPPHTRTELTWKGPAIRDTGYKVREELSTAVGDDQILIEILARLGFAATRILEREVIQYSCAGALIRFEQFPVMDTLVEVEGEPDAIERAIQWTGLPRSGFTSERLADFVGRFEERTGRTAVLARPPPL
jgi:adenylate cyclase class IV